MKKAKMVTSKNGGMVSKASTKLGKASTSMMSKKGNTSYSPKLQKIG